MTSALRSSPSFHPQPVNDQFVTQCMTVLQNEGMVLTTKIPDEEVALSENLPMDEERRPGQLRKSEWMEKLPTIDEIANASLSSNSSVENDPPEVLKPMKYEKPIEIDCSDVRTKKKTRTFCCVS